jgi:hypothetical protein
LTNINARENAAERIVLLVASDLRLLYVQDSYFVQKDAALTSRENCGLFFVGIEDLGRGMADI